MFTARYRLTKLLYHEVYTTPFQAIVREKQIKDMSRREKLAMIRKANPEFKDLSKLPA